MSEQAEQEQVVEKSVQEQIQEFVGIISKTAYENKYSITAIMNGLSASTAAFLTDISLTDDSSINHEALKRNTENFIKSLNAQTEFIVSQLSTILLSVEDVESNAEPKEIILDSNAM